MADVPSVPAEPEAAPRAAGWLGGVSALSAGGAVLAKSCCVVPLALASLGAGGALSGWLEALAPYSPYLIGLSLAGLAGGWLFFLRSPKQVCAADGSCAVPAARRRGAVLLGLATAVTLLALARERVEPLVVGLLMGGA